MHEATIICRSFIGDSLFASSVAEQFKKQGKYEKVNLHIRVPQPIELLQSNPYIDEVRIVDTKFPTGDIYEIPASTFLDTPPVQYQLSTGILYPVNSYQVYLPEYMAELQTENVENLPLVVWQMNWEERSFLFNEEQYWHNDDVPYKGYGGANRNIPFIINYIEQNTDAILVPVGLDNGVTQFDLRTSVESYNDDALTISHADLFIGAEGGMSNLAAGLGTRCIITTDFIWQLYGPRGIMKRISDPQMGPAKLFPDRDHVHLDPFLTDIEVAEHITSTINAISLTKKIK